MFVACAATGLSLAMSGCAGTFPPALSGSYGSSSATTAPTSATPTVGQEQINQTGSSYFADWVALPDGGQVLCVRFIAPSGPGVSMSCDWLHAKPAVPKH